MKRVRVTIDALEKPLILDLAGVCLQALGIQHAKRMRNMILSVVACLALRYFFFFYIISQTSRISKTSYGHKECVMAFSTTFV